MKRILLSILLLPLFICLSAAPVKKDTLRILAIGNSFSDDALENNFWDIAHADNRCVIVGNMYIGGCSLERHRNNMLSDAPEYRYFKIGADGVKNVIREMSLSASLKDDEWDIVTFQQCSPLSGKADSYEPYLSELIGYVKSFRPDARLMFHQTWAYAVDATHSCFPDYGCDAERMYAEIMEASRKACDEHNLEVIPSGTAIQNLRMTDVKEANITRDGYHLNFGVGRYTAACTWYSAIFGRKAAGNGFIPAHMTQKTAAIAQLAADNAVSNPYKVSDFGFRRMFYNKDESRVGKYVLPDPLTFKDGSRVKNRKQWEKKRRGELLEDFTTLMYGRMPSSVKYFEPVVREVKEDALGGLAVRKQVRIYLNASHRQWLDLLVYTPASLKGKACPLFLGINFYGNACISMEEDIPYPDRDEASRYGIYKQWKRGQNARRWPLEAILERGYGVATFHREDVCPDYDHTACRGVQSIYPKDCGAVPGPDQWGAISAWAWGLSRAMDYLVTDADVDGSRVAVIGHSRLGKTALWAGANDPRFAMIVSNDSGTGGASLSRRDFGETLHMINIHFPHWFCDNFKRFDLDPSLLPFDQHELIALCAPRPVCVGSATEDFNADPEGERLSLEAARPVWTLYGAGLDERLDYHIRKGGHDILLEDWTRYMDHADKYLK